MKGIGKRAGLKSAQRTSGKEVARHLMPGRACAMSFTDRVIANNPKLKLDEIADFSTNKLAPVFDEMISIGIIPAELEESETN
jgi:hypothetical protein